MKRVFEPGVWAAAAAIVFGASLQMASAAPLDAELCRDLGERLRAHLKIEAPLEQGVGEATFFASDGSETRAEACILRLAGNGRDFEHGDLTAIGPIDEALRYGFGIEGYEPSRLHAVFDGEDSTRYVMEAKRGLCEVSFSLSARTPAADFEAMMALPPQDRRYALRIGCIGPE